MQWYIVDDALIGQPPLVRTMILRAERNDGLYNIIWNATAQAWEQNNAALRYFNDGTATLVSEDEARMWAERLGTSLQTALDVLAEFVRRE